jgi:hypothetical protein
MADQAPGDMSAGGVVVRPGDTLIVGFHPALSLDQSNAIKERIAESLPGVRIAVMDQVAAMTVYRPEGT